MKILKKLSYLGIVLPMLALSTSCTKDFVEINTNPNASTAASPQSLLAPALVSTINSNLDRCFRINNEFMQVTVTLVDSREFQRYEVRPSESEPLWRNWYLQLTNFRDIYETAEHGQQAGYQTFQGISLILDTWVSSLITDMFGDVPYFESNLGKYGNTTPKFDAQRDIYEDLFRKLDSANVLLSANVNLPSDLASTDPIYGGVANKWRRFGNSLYLRLLMRVAHKSDIDAVSKITQIVSNPSTYPLMASNDDSAVLYFTGSLPYVTQFYNARDYDFNGDKGYSQFFINSLLDLKDPRLPVWATEASLGFYSGMQSGYPKGSVPDRQSTLQLALKTEPRLGNIMNYAELQFILAEAAIKGYITGNADTYYRNGVNASIAFWDKTITNDYFNNPAVNLLETDDQTDQLKKVYLQRYFSMLFTDFQQWYEYRRTNGMLDLYKGPGLLNGGNMPIRLNYPLIVQSLNRANYEDAVARLGGKDDINGKMWWQP